MQTVYAFPTATEVLLLAANHGPEALAWRVLPEAAVPQWMAEALCSPPELASISSTHTHPWISPNTSNSPLLFVLSELSGLVATSLRNFPQPQEPLSSPEIVAEKQKADWLSRLLLSEYRLALGVQGSLCPFLHPAPNNSPHL